MAHKNPRQIARLVRRLASPSSTFFIHLDRRAGREIERELLHALNDVPRVELIERSPIRWGDSSLLKAGLRGLEASLTTDAQHTVMLSGQDYPIKRPDAIEDYLAANAGTSLLEHAPLPRADWANTGGGFDRVRFVHLRVPRRGLSRTPLRRHMPSGLRLHGGEAVGAIAREHVEYVVAYARSEPAARYFFRWGLVVEELFLHSVLLNSPHASAVRSQKIHFVRWGRRGAADAIDETAHPAILTRADLPELARSGALFARKFDLDRHPDALDQIDLTLAGGQRHRQGRHRAGLD